MVTGTLKSKMDQLWLAFHAGGITNPLTVIEQISYLMFARLLDIKETRNEKRSERLKSARVDRVFTERQQALRWSHFRHLKGDKMLAVVRDQLFPFFREDVVKRTELGKYLQGAQCLIPSAELLVKAVNMIDDLPLTKSDTKGDLYEYMLSKLTTAGIAGQFRTPRHIIRAMVEMLEPKPTEVIADPACGTGGFLVGVMDYLTEKYSSPELIHEEIDTDGSIEKHYPGDLLEPYRPHIQNDMFYGFDFDATMLRIAAMNLLLHGIESPSINYQDTLGTAFTENFPREATDYFDCILANPPFKGSIDAENIHPTLKSKVKTTKTELLFIVLMLRMLTNGGRCAVIVPEGVLFGSSAAHAGVRKILVDENQLEGVVSLPSGVFKPYAGVSTAILIFTKGGRTDRVWFYKVERDGFSLDDKRTKLPPNQNDLPDLVKQWHTRNPRKQKDRTKKGFYVPVAEIRENGHDLSVSRYREEIYEEAVYDPPKVILKRMRKLEKSICADIDELEGMLP